MNPQRSASPAPSALARLQARRIAERPVDQGVSDRIAPQPEGGQPESQGSQPLVIVDLCSGLNGWTQAARANGHRVLAFDADPKLPADVHVDVRQLTADDVRAALRARGWSERPDVVVASPPCEGFSVASCGKHWDHPSKDVYRPKSDGARLGWEVAAAVRDLTLALNPRLGYLIENPRGMMHKVGVMAALGQWREVWQCKYRDERGAAKPTVLWAGGLIARAFEYRTCRNMDHGCHEPGFRGTQDSGTQAVKAHDGYSAANWRSVIAPGMGREMLKAALAADRIERLG